MALIEKRRERFTEATIEDETVVMRIDNGEFFSISGTGLDIWELIDGTRDRDALLAALEAGFDAPQGVIGAELDAFLAELTNAGLIDGG
jgi:pyrroloquinoline quinone biosynthesis protein D